MLDKSLPPGINTENHDCGYQLGFTLTGMTRTWYDLEDKVVVTECPECEEELPSEHERFEMAGTVASGVKRLPSV